ncbi:MAG: hypothetical protein IMF19_04520 [Proteobacteria bacterium]|nr:hypothetical protein [Pseudomonadota bacterium]
MKNLFILLITIFLGLSLITLSLADDRYPLTGNTYVLELGDVAYELSGFECTFGPGCQADCDLWHGDFDTGPLYHSRLPFSCEESGDVIIAGIPCALDSQGNLECLAVDVSGYTCIKLGTKTWCLPGKPGEFQFDLAN